MLYFFLYYDTALRYGVLTTELMLRNNNNYYYYQKRGKDPIEKLEKLHTQFYKHFIGVNRRAINIISHNIVLSLKSNISISVIKFWLPLGLKSNVFYFQINIISCCHFMKSKPFILFIIQHHPISIIFSCILLKLSL